MNMATGGNALSVGADDVVGPASLGMQTAWLTLGREWPAEYQGPDHRISSLGNELKVTQAIIWERTKGDASHYLDFLAFGSFYRKFKLAES